MSLPGKFLARVGKAKTLFDRRRLWASEPREFVGWDELSKGERRARHAFANLITGTPTRPALDPIEAVREALGLTAGHIPEYETIESFEDYWTHARLVEISNRWRQSPYFRAYSQEQVKAAHTQLGAAAGLFADTLVKTCLNEKASTNARVRAAQVGLAAIGIVAGSKIEDEVAGKGDALKKQGRLLLLKKPEPATGTDGGGA